MAFLGLSNKVAKFVFPIPAAELTGYYGKTSAEKADHNATEQPIQTTNSHPAVELRGIL